MGNYKFIEEDFRGYKQSTVPKIDEVLARTDPKTACGEYLRRYWHPVALTSEVSHIPREIRILGEDLVIFKTSKGNIGLFAINNGITSPVFLSSWAKPTNNQSLDKAVSHSFFQKFSSI